MTAARPLRWGLRGKLLAFLFGSALVFSALMIAVDNLLERKNDLERMETRVRGMAVMVAADSVNAMADSNLRALRRRLRDLREQDEVAYAYFLDADGKVITDGTVENPWRDRSFTDAAGAAAAAATAPLVRHDDDMMEAASPVELSDRRIGAVRVGFSLDKMNAHIRATRRRNLVLLAAFLVAALGFGSLMASTLVEPIAALAAGTRRVAAGDLGMRVEVATNDELAGLAESFNAMVGRLRVSTEKLQSSVKEKEVLLREVNHRVKNNLQVVSALLNIQAGSTGDEKTRAALLECRARVEAMSVIHSQLYRGSDAGSVEMRPFLKDLAGHVLYSFVGTGRPVSLRVHSDDLRLSTSQAIACGLIVNELITNALKYAFPRGAYADPAIEVSLRGAPDGGTQLTVKDNGEGLPGGLPPPKAGGMGLNLVDLLAKGDLGGTVEVLSGPGTAVRVRFPSA